MIDLIIPVYNNPEGLNNTLASINFNIFEVTVVDDGSKNEYNITYPVHMIRQENAGPGMARQAGINNTSNDFFMFIDAGDTFVSQEIQEKILYSTIVNKDANMISWLFEFWGSLTDRGDNRLVGKIYRRAFINHYNISFCKEGSYFNEDIGFNRACRVILDYLKKPIIYYDEPIISCVYDENSLTQHDDREFCYIANCRGLAVNGIHEVETCIKNYIHPQQEIQDLAGCLFYWFIRAVAERPELAHYAWEGARLFYKKYERFILRSHIKLTPADQEECDGYYHDGAISFEPDPRNFYRDIMQYEEMPSRYLNAPIV